MGKRKSSGESEQKPESFEAAFTELQAIVSELEEGTIGLEESLARFERGMQLLRRCHSVLETAQQRIEQLTGLDAEGNPLTEPFDASATSEMLGESAGRRAQRGSSPAPTGPDDDPSPGQTLF